ncbi:MAG TPA: AtpZ/AtpI family protein [Ignavibacteriales bacterium]|nr:AtpZ/AtpI family protein [Ignavibacteriales bacterium]
MEDPEEQKRKKKKELNWINDINPGKKAVEVGPYLGLGVQLAASIVLMFFLGYWLDGKLGTSPVLTILMSFLGGFAGIYNVIKTVLEINRKNKGEKGS